MERNKQRVTAIKDILPPGSICSCCKRSIMKVSQWRLSVFGDAICKVCLEQDKLVHPELYADPVMRHRAMVKLASSITADLKPNIRHERRQHESTPDLPADYWCGTCGVGTDAKPSRYSWVYEGIADGSGLPIWTCKTCFYTLYSTEFTVGEYREDRFYRVFQVVVCSVDGSEDRLVARYPHGYQSLPPASIPVSDAYEAVFDIQQAEMHDLVQSHLSLIVSIVERLHRSYARATSVTIDEVYDAAIDAAMRAATLHDVSKPFVHYMRSSIYRHVAKMMRKRVNNARRMGPMLSITGNLASVIIDGVPRYDSGEWEKYEQELEECIDACEMVVGPENWEIMKQWVVEGRRQVDIGADLGIVSQAISMRIRKVIERCRNHVPPPSMLGQI